MTVFRLISMILMASFVTAQVSAFADLNPMPPKPTGTIRLVTWNIMHTTWVERLSGIFGLSVADLRLRQIKNILKAMDPDLIALQEVSARFLLVDEHQWNMYSTTTNNTLDPPGGLVIFSRFPISNFQYLKHKSSPSGRYAQIAIVNLGGVELTIANVHFESYLESRWHREAQLVEVDLILDADKPSMLLGDFNFGPEEPENKHPSLSSWIDGWARLHSAAGVTYDINENLLARKNAFKGETSRRLDRIFVNNMLEPVAADLVGLPVEEEPPPSDHYGLLLDVRVPQLNDE